VEEEPVVLDVVQTEAEAELLCSLLRSAGIECAQRVSNRGAGAFAATGGVGPYEVLVHRKDLDAGREILDTPAE
jgi:Putative prokaryotic signal transducing protein